MDYFKKKEGGCFEMGLWTALGIIGVAALAVMIFFLTKYPIPLVAGGSWAKNNDYLMLYVGFAAIIGGIIEFMNRQKRKNMPSAPMGVTVPVQPQLHPAKRMQMIIAAIVWGALIAFVLAKGIMPGIMWSIENGN